MNPSITLYYYRFATAKGVISLVPDTHGRYKVMYDNEDLGSYASAEMAVDDVRGGHTYSPSNGVDFADLEIPELSEWERKPFATIRKLRKG